MFIPLGYKDNGIRKFCLLQFLSLQKSKVKNGKLVKFPVL